MNVWASEAAVRTWLLLWVRRKPWQEQAWTDVITWGMERRGGGWRRQVTWEMVPQSRQSCWCLEMAAVELGRGVGF